MPIHKDIPVGVESSHPPGYVQSGDPGAVGAYKVWIDTSAGTGLWVKKIRNAADSGWETVGGGVTTLDGLTDVVITAAASGDILRHNGTNWVDAAGIVATDITSGTVPTARLGSGTADATTFLRGDQTYAVPAGGGGSSLPIDAAAAAAVGSGDLFPGTSLDGGWSSLQATALTSIDRSVAGYAIFKNTGNTGGVDRGLKRTFSPAGDFEVYCNILSCTSAVANQWPGVFIGKADPSDAAGGERCDLNIYSTAGGLPQLQFVKWASTTPTVVFDRSVSATTMDSAQSLRYWPFPVWLRIKRVGSTVTAGVCWDGVQFIDQATTTTIAFTVATIGLILAEGSATVDIRAVYKYIATVG